MIPLVLVSAIIIILLITAAQTIYQKKKLNYTNVALSIIFVIFFFTAINTYLFKPTKLNEASLALINAEPYRLSDASFQFSQSGNTFNIPTEKVGFDAIFKSADYSEAYLLTFEYRSTLWYYAGLFPERVKILILPLSEIYSDII